MSALVLIIEDEPDLVAMLEYNLKKEGYQTRSALTGGGGLELAWQEPAPDLILLDLMLPDISGNEVCRKLRGSAQTENVPILMVTAKGEEIDRIVGFEMGADDYVVKPYSVRELMLRVRARLKPSKDSVPDSDAKIKFGVLVFDSEAHRVWVEDTEVLLTALEFKLLDTLLSRKGRVQSRDRLLDDVWGYEVAITTRTVDTHVKRLREKLGTAGEYIETVRGVGYRMKDSLSGVAV
ncbi:MAG: response regulator transcription factor [Deltaproteobacteria bacterium]|nr:response regulator transcription factor [Deltaproteobacteria bacterium]